MNVLIGCEYSAIVRRSFEARGHNAWSCDLLPSEHPGKHRQCGIMELMSTHRWKWDLLILHPPCTKIALCGNATYGRGMPKHGERMGALDWTAALWDKAIMTCRRVVLENPKNVLGSRIGKRTQAIQPYEYGHMEQKETWLWLHRVPKLLPTKNVFDDMMKLPKRERENSLYGSK